MAGLFGLIASAERMVQKIAAPTVTGLVCRFALAGPFLASGLLKWNFLENSKLIPYYPIPQFSPIPENEGLLSLRKGIWPFEDHKLHLFGNEIPYPFPEAMAFSAGVAEIVLPLLLIFGLFTRFAALGLLVMSIVIQLTQPLGFLQHHLLWAALAMALMYIGPGGISLDYLMGKRAQHS